MIHLILLLIPSLLSAGCFTDILCCCFCDESSRSRVPTTTTPQMQELDPLPVHQDASSLREQTTLQVLGTPALQAPPTPRLQPLDVEALGAAVLEPATQPSPTQGESLPSNRVQEGEEDKSNDRDSPRSQSREDEYHRMNGNLFSFLYKRIMNNQEEVLKLLRERNDPRDYLTHLDCSKDTILHYACDLGHGDVVEKIVKDIGNNCDILRVHNSAGLTPFDIADAKKDDGPQYERIWICLNTDAIAAMRTRGSGSSDEQKPARRSRSSVGGNTQEMSRGSDSETFGEFDSGKFGGDLFWTLQGQQ